MSVNLNYVAWENSLKGRTIRKPIGGEGGEMGRGGRGGGGGGRSTKKYSPKGKLNGKKFMHGN